MHPAVDGVGGGRPRRGRQREEAGRERVRGARLCQGGSEPGEVPGDRVDERVKGAGEGQRRRVGGGGEGRGGEGERDVGKEGGGARGWGGQGHRAVGGEVEQGGAEEGGGVGELVHVAELWVERHGDFTVGLQLREGNSRTIGRETDGVTSTSGDQTWCTAVC